MQNNRLLHQVQKLLSIHIENHITLLGNNTEIQLSKCTKSQNLYILQYEKRSSATNLSKFKTFLQLGT